MEGKGLRGLRKVKAKKTLYAFVGFILVEFVLVEFVLVEFMLASSC